MFRTGLSLGAVAVGLTVGLTTGTPQRTHGEEPRAVRPCDLNSVCNKYDPDWDCYDADLDVWFTDGCRSDNPLCDGLPGQT
ncbi:MAG: hypothetical protein D6701_00955 [Gemmatimonadetes bacterium]|nr:MAG: hypothetical protein D6701_00955 [Gemmatimonadota bacterium]